MYDKHPFCHIAHRWVCPCLYGGFGGTPLTRDQMSRLLHGYMEEVSTLIDSGRYERDDFTVVIQPAFTNLNLFSEKRWVGWWRGDLTDTHYNANYQVQHSAWPETSDWLLLLCPGLPAPQSEAARPDGPGSVEQHALTQRQESHQLELRAAPPLSQRGPTVPENKTEQSAE